MYKDTSHDWVMLYDYVGMATSSRMPSSIFHDSFSLEELELIKNEAREFRDKELDWNPSGYSLQALERGVTEMIDYCTKYIRRVQGELYVYGFGLKGIHYFKEHVHN